MKLIIRSILILSKEKLCVLSDEVDFIYDICNYHQGDGTKNASLKKDLEENFRNLKKQLIFISMEIIKIDKKISTHLSYENQDERELLFFIDYYAKNINKIIQQLKLINEKTSQMFRDGYNQYIPKPTPGRMLSNINMTSQVEESLEKRLDSFFDRTKQENTNELSAQIIWEYTKSYRITTHTNNRDTHKEKSFNIAFFRMSYWYFDLPYLIPALTHEISHIALEEKTYNEYVHKIIKNIKNEVFRKEADSLFRKKIIDVKFIDNIVKEVLADIFSLLHHGTSYIFTMSHELLGYYFASSFEYDENKKSINIAQWRFNSKRDRSFIRLSVLISFQQLIQKTIEDKKINCDIGLFSLGEKYLDEIESLLSIIYSKNKLDSPKKSIKNYYENWHNYLPEFEELEEFILFFVDSLNAELSNEKDWLIEVLKNTKSHTSVKQDTLPSSYKKTIEEFGKKRLLDCKVPQFYNDLWEMRFMSLDQYDLVPHKGELRKKIHRKTIDYLYNKGKLDLENIKPYILTFYKYKVDTGNKKKNNIPYEATLGIYDRVKIESEKEFIFPIPRSIDEEKKQYEKYTLKFSLMKILNDITGTAKDEYLNIVIQMEIKKDLKSNDAYEVLNERLDDLYDTFTKQKELFGKVEFFKSLGPKDIILRIENLSIDSIYKIKSQLAKKFDRTFTTISYNTQKEDNKENVLASIKSDRTYRLSTELRLSPDKELKIPLMFKEKVKELLMIPGVMDYQIEWDIGTSLDTIESFYDEMIGKKIISDIQTLFIKNVDKSIFFNSQKS